MMTRPTLPPLPLHTFGEPPRFWATRDQAEPNGKGDREERQVTKTVSESRI